VAEKDAPPSGEFGEPRLPEPNVAKPSTDPGCSCKCGEETGSGGGAG
jgi:hypothetical protein